MNDAHILINNGSVIFSDALLQQFPEITATVVGNKIIVDNVWREDLISVIGDNVFWAEKQDFLSYSIVFENNKTSVAELNNLIVRYVNFHDGNYEIAMPIYTSSIDILRDPLGLGLKPNYYNTLQKYVDGQVTISDVASTVAGMYSAVSIETTIDEGLIEDAILAIPIDDIVTFLDSNLSAMDTYNLVKNNGTIGDTGTGVKSYTLTTAGKELSFNEKDGVIEVTKLCVKDGEDVAEIVAKVIENAPTITQCVLKNINSQQFSDAQFTRITTDFGIHADITRDGGYKSAKIYYDSTDLVPDFSYMDTISPVLWGEFIADIIEKSSIFSLEYVNVYGMRSTYGTFGTPRTATLGTYGLLSGYLSTGGKVAEAYAVAKDILLEKSITMYIDSVYASSVIPFSLIEDATYGNSYSYPEQFFESANILRLSAHGLSVPLFDNGVVAISTSGDFSFVGTPLHDRVTKVIIRNQADENILMVQALHLGFTNVDSGIQNFGIADSIGYGFEAKYLEDGIIDIIDAGVTQFSKLSSVSELAVSKERKQISVTDITHGSLLICPFGEATGTLGYFESGFETQYLIEDIIGNTNYYVMNLNRYKFAMTSILVNGVSIADKDGLLKVIVGTQPISVGSAYSLRSQDVSLFTSMFTSLRQGYEEEFRFGSTSDIISSDDDSFAYSVLSKFYDVLIGDIGITGVTVSSVMTAHHNLVTIAQGGDISISSIFDDMQDYDIRRVVNVTNIDFSISLGGVSKALSTISSSHPSQDVGSITFSSDSADTIDFTYGNINDALANATPVDPSNYSIDVFMHHTFIDNVLVLYFANAGYSNGGRFTNVFHVAINVKTTKAVHSGYTQSQNTPQVPTSWGTIATIPTSSSNVVADSGYVHYTFTDNGDGSVTVNYIAYDKDGNDITDQFSTLSIGDYFLHKEVV